ncbi:MAG: prolipoprotein diacylglyceryl transferase [Balneolaceae bacterium]|nr:prolipoprotein diacylglyceryl transferase [Balneolaceae bacterium]
MLTPALIMQATDHLVWQADRVAFNLGTLHLPIPVSIIGVAAGVALLFLLYPKLKEKANEGNGRPSKGKGKGEPAEPPAWQVLALLAGALAVGQFLFQVVIPTSTISAIGPIQPHWYGFLFAMAFVAGFAIESRLFRDGGRSMEELEQLLTYILIATVVGARLGHILFYDPVYYLTHPSQILAVWEGGLASHGAAIGILLAMYLFVRKRRDMSFLWLADRVVVVVALGGAFIRTGNFVNSEIIGKPTELPWGVIFSRIDMVPRHPTMLYEALLCLLVFGILLLVYRRYRRQPPEGSLFGIFLVLLFGGRFLLEYTKVFQAEFAANWMFNMGQLLSIPLIVLGLWLLARKVDWSAMPAATTDDATPPESG